MVNGKVKEVIRLIGRAGYKPIFVGKKKSLESTVNGEEKRNVRKRKKKKKVVKKERIDIFPHFFIY